MSNPPSPQAVPFITLPNWLRAATRCGFDIEPIFRRVGIATDLVHLETATVERKVLQSLMEACVEQAGDVHFPFVLGETFTFDYLPDLETFVDTAPTLREAARVFTWVRPLIDPGLDVRVVEAGRLARLLMLTVGRPPSAWFSEALASAVVKFGRRLMNDEADFSRLCFRHPAPTYADAYERFFRMPVVFGQAMDALEMDVTLLDRPRRGAYPALHEQARVRIERRQQEAQAGMTGTVETLLARRGELLAAGIDGAAEALGLHPRSLQRRLRGEGVRFVDLLARVRYRLAVQALEDPNLDLESLSERLGFSDRRSFTRAFAQWSGGVTPSAFRDRVMENERKSR